MSDKILYYNDVKQTPAGDGTAAPPSDTDNKKVETAISDDLNLAKLWKKSKIK